MSAINRSFVDYGRQQLILSLSECFELLVYNRLVVLHLTISAVFEAAQLDQQVFWISFHVHLFDSKLHILAAVTPPSILLIKLLRLPEQV